MKLLQAAASGRRPTGASSWAINGCLPSSQWPTSPRFPAGLFFSERAVPLSPWWHRTCFEPLECLASITNDVGPRRRMSLADACIERHAILMLDSDFSVYRKHGRVPLALIHPADE